MDLSNINFLAVLVSALASFAIGALWYSPVLFGKAWQKELGFTDEDLQGSNMAMIFGTTLVMILIMAFGMGMLLHGHYPKELITAKVGIFHGLYIGLAFVATSTAINYLYQRKSIKLWAIDSFYQITYLVLQGAILGIWK